MPGYFDESQNIKLCHGTDRCFRGTLSDVATDITIQISGLYKITASVDWCGRGPSSATSAATKASSQFWFAKESALVYCVVGEHVSQVIASSATASGRYYVDLLQPRDRA